MTPDASRAVFYLTESLKGRLRSLFAIGGIIYLFAFCANRDAEVKILDIEFGGLRPPIVVMAASVTLVHFLITSIIELKIEKHSAQIEDARIAVAFTAAHKQQISPPDSKELADTKDILNKTLHGASKIQPIAQIYYIILPFGWALIALLVAALYIFMPVVWQQHMSLTNSANTIRLRSTGAGTSCQPRTQIIPSTSANELSFSGPMEPRFRPIATTIRMEAWAAGWRATPSCLPTAGFIATPSSCRTAGWRAVSGSTNQL